MSLAWPSDFNPLLRAVSNDEARLALVQSQVRSILDSYHGRLDAFAEALQNAVDAIEDRWSAWAPSDDDATGDDDVPRVEVHLNFDENYMEVVDNGLGISPADLEALLEPFGSNKRGKGKRGHKGVGTTFLAYGHPRFQLHTKHATLPDPVAYQIEGGRSWALEPLTTSQAPEYRKMDVVHPRLAKFESGTAVRVYFDGTTPIRDLSTLRHNTPLMWATVVRPATALGRVGLEDSARYPWVDQLVATISHRDGTEQIPFAYPLPHIPVKPPLTAELQWLHNNPGTTRQYELIYAEKSHDELKVLLSSALKLAENSESPDLVAIAKDFYKYEAAAYGSLAFKNTYYDEQFKGLIKKPNAERLSLDYSVGGGVAIASLSMPMSVLLPHLAETMQPQVRRRYFLLVHLNGEFSPDIGRKTMPADVHRLVEWLEDEILKILSKQGTRLIRDRESSTRRKGASSALVKEELKTLRKEIEDLESMDDGADLAMLAPSRTPRWEPEVAAAFQTLVTKGHLDGYVMRAYPNARYDAFFDLDLDYDVNLSYPDELRVFADQYADTDTFSLTDRWAEFKVDAEALIVDFEAEDGSPSKKYFESVDLCVSWRASGSSSDQYTLEKFDTASAIFRQFPGSTHRIVPDQGEHWVEVICLEDLIPLISADE